MARTREGWLEEGRMEHCHLPEPGLLARKEAYYRCCCSKAILICTFVTTKYSTLDCFSSKS